MNKLLMVLLLTAAAKFSDAQAGVSDTLSYLQTIVANKDLFVGKPFHVLRNSVAIQIRYFHPRMGVIHDITRETSTRLGFHYPQQADELYLTYPSLEIYWSPFLDATQSGILYTQHNGGGWSAVVAAFYMNATIADIKIRE